MQKESYERKLWIGLGLTVIVIAVFSLAWLGEPSRMTRAAAAAGKTGVRQGRELYVANCTACHGTRGEGGVGPALNNKTLLAQASDDVLFALIRAGRPVTTMPAWGQVNGGPLTDEDIRYVVSFLRAWEPNAPIVVASAVAPSAARGAALFNGTCFVCHGEDGRGGAAPALNEPGRLSRQTDDWYRQTILNGRPAKEMPTWAAVLAASQVEDLVALIGAWRKGEKVAPTTTVAALLDQALFTLGQGDAEDALFYMNRARPLAFGPAQQQFDPLMAQMRAGQLDKALNDLAALRKQWPVGDAAKGQAVYKDACQGCHGADGQGGVGRRLKPNEFVQQSANADMLKLLLTGRAGTAMRSFAGQLTEEQLANAIAFLRAWQP